MQRTWNFQKVLIFVILGHFLLYLLFTLPTLFLITFERIMKTRNNYFIFRVKVLLQRASFFRNFVNFPFKFSSWGWLNSKYLIYCMVRQLSYRFQKFNWFCCSYLRKFQTSILVWGLSKAKFLPFRSIYIALPCSY